MSESTGGHSRSKLLTIRHTVGARVRSPIFPWKLRQPLAGGMRESPGELSNADRDQILRDDACLRRGSLIEAPLVAALAQLVEHIIRNDGVTGSSPVSGTSTFPRTSLDVQLKGLSRGNGNGSSLGHFGKGKWLNRGDISLGLLEFADDPIWQRTCIAPCVTTPVGRFQAVRFRTENERSRY